MWLWSLKKQEVHESGTIGSPKQQKNKKTLLPQMEF